MAGLEAQKKKREEAANAKRESSAHKAKGAAGGKDADDKQASLNLELNARLLQKAQL